MRATMISFAILAASGGSECRAIDWEVNLESNISSTNTFRAFDQNGYQWDSHQDGAWQHFQSTPDLLKAEATFRPSEVGGINWEIGVGATVRPGSRLDRDQHSWHANLGDLDGSLTIRATIRPRSSRSVR
jgi:hypothetical protein